MRVDIMWPHHTTRSCGLTGGKLANVRTLRRFVVRQQLCALTVCRPRPFHVKTLVVLAPVLATSAPDESMNWMNSRVLVCAVDRQSFGGSRSFAHSVKSRSEVGIACTVFRTAMQHLRTHDCSTVAERPKAYAAPGIAWSSLLGCSIGAVERSPRQ